MSRAESEAKRSAGTVLKEIARFCTVALLLKRRICVTPGSCVVFAQVRRAVAQLRQAEACRARLEQRCRFEGGPGSEEDASLLHHWVEELDDFRVEETAFMGKMRCATGADDVS